MRKQIIFILLLVGLIFPIGSIFAQPTTGFPMESKLLTTDTNLAVAANKEIYGYTLVATTAAAYIGLYDKTTFAVAGTDDCIDEGSEATQHASVTVWYPKPLVTSNGCSVVLNNGNATLYYQK